jgi:hypothetical protein
MRTLILSSALLAVFFVGSYALFSASLAAARDARPASFEERFDRAVKPR